jgi:RNA polymerase sigma-70 factor (ECF subfamily)
MIGTETQPRLPRPDQNGAGDDEFMRLAYPFHRELLAHCYRMLGSVHDAEDLVQETYLRAWRAYERFEGRSSLRVWLYRIATTACLTALDHRSRRHLPAGLNPAGSNPDRLQPIAEGGIDWVQPLPDAMAADPAAIVAGRDSVRLAFIAALQHLPAKQRAVLILRDVLAWRASEVAEFLGITTNAVNSSLLRARAQIREAAPEEDDLAEPAHPVRRQLLDHYITAFEEADVNGLVRLLHEDAVLEMPPNQGWFAGREPVVRFLAANVISRCGPFRLIPVAANGQPAVAAYMRGEDGVPHAHAIQVLTVRSARISRIVSFNDASLFPLFGLPTTLADDRTAAGPCS